MNQQTPAEPVLPTEAFDAIFRAESLEERIEFQQCGGYQQPTCDARGGGPITTTPEPATLVLAATGIGAVGLGSYLRRRAARRRDERSSDAPPRE